VIAEQDPRAWIAAAQAALGSMTAGLPAAAKVLGMSFRALRYRIKKLGIE